MRNTNKKGFTIVELVIVVAVIAILAAVLIPTFSGIIAKANLSADQQAVRQMNTVLATEDGSMSLTELNKALRENGIVPDGYRPLSADHEFYYDTAKNCVVLWSVADSKVVFPKGYENVTAVATTWDWFDLDEMENIQNEIQTGNVVVSESLADASTKPSDFGIIVSNDATIEFADGVKYEYSVDFDMPGRNGTVVSALVVNDDATVTINNATIESEGYGIYLYDGTLTIKGGTYSAETYTAVQIGTGKLVIEGGTFSSSVEGYNKYLINALDGQWKDGISVIEIKGGSFFNFDPSQDCESVEGVNGKKNYLADGFKVISEEKDGGVWYTVVAE